MHPPHSHGGPIMCCKLSNTTPVSITELIVPQSIIRGNTDNRYHTTTYLKSMRKCLFLLKRLVIVEKKGRGAALLIVSEDFRTCFTPEAGTSLQRAPHTHTGHTACKARRDYRRIIFRMLPLSIHWIDRFCVCACERVLVLPHPLCVRKRVQEVLTSVCVSGSPKPDWGLGC